jgi:dipeptidase E
MKRHIIAIGGAALPPELDNLKLVRYVLAQTRRRNPRVCFIGTASGDSEAGRLRFYAGFSRFECRPSHLALFARTPRDLASYLMEHDAIVVGGGNTRSMLAVWREWALDAHLRSAWEQGVVLCGWSAGAICWFEQGITDSIAGALTAMSCLGWLAGSCCPHYDSEPLRRPTFRRLVSRGAVPDGVAADDGAALHYVGTRLERVVSSRRKARGWRVVRAGRTARESRLPTRYLQMRLEP